MALFAAGLAFPGLAVAGTTAFWALAPFQVAAFVALWMAFRSNYRAGRMRETLTFGPGRLVVRREEADGSVREWSANPAGVRVAVADAPHCENYLTLSADGSCIEVGAFLSPEERLRLGSVLRARLRGAVVRRRD